MMKRSLLFQMTAASLLALGLAVPVSAHAVQADGSAPPPAQGAPPPDRGAEMQQRQLERMTRLLNLTPDQVTQIRAIQADALAQMTALRNEGSGADRRARMLALREAEQSKVKAVLTDQQKVKFDAMLEEMKQRRQQGDAPPPPPPPPQ